MDICLIPAEFAGRNSTEYYETRRPRRPPSSSALWRGNRQSGWPFPFWFSGFSRQKQNFFYVLPCRSSTPLRLHSRLGRAGKKAARNKAVVMSKCFFLSSAKNALLQNAVNVDGVNVTQRTEVFGRFTEKRSRCVRLAGARGGSPVPNRRLWMNWTDC